MKRKRFESFLWLLKLIWNLQEFSKLLRDFLHLVLVCKEISPRYGNDKNKAFFSTVINWGRLINNSSTNVFKQLSTNDKGYPVFKNIGISPLTFKKTKPSEESAIREHFLNCNNISSFEEFTILTNKNKKFDLEIKEILLIKRDRPILNKNISSGE